MICRCFLRGVIPFILGTAKKRIFIMSFGSPHRAGNYDDVDAWNCLWNGVIFPAGE